MGTANPMPANASSPAGAAIETTMPMTSPCTSSSGPPELPGLTDASNWMSPENLPLLIDHKARFLPEEFSQKISAARNEKKTAWFDTHPCDTDRVNAVQALGESGVFRLEEPATALFSDFAALSKAVTRFHYEKNWELKFTAENLVSSDEMLRESTANAEADAAVRLFYGTVNVALVPLLREGDIVAICDAGAYGSAMASNYNRRPLPAEVLVDGGAWRVIRRRQTIEEQLSLGT